MFCFEGIETSELYLRNDASEIRVTPSQGVTNGLQYNRGFFFFYQKLKNSPFNSVVELHHFKLYCIGSNPTRGYKFHNRIVMALLTQWKRSTFYNELYLLLWNCIESFKGIVAYVEFLVFWFLFLINGSLCLLINLFPFLVKKWYWCPCPGLSLSHVIDFSSLCFTNMKSLVQKNLFANFQDELIIFLCDSNFQLQFILSKFYFFRSYLKILFVTSHSHFIVK